MIRKIAITGGIASGKSYVAKFIEYLGYCVWDADLFAREVLFCPNVTAKIKSSFGDHVFLKPGELDRIYLRKLIFSNAESRKTLESILHPAIADLFQQKLNTLTTLSSSMWVFYEATLIIEAGRKNDFDCCIMVKSNKDIRLQRLQEKRNISYQEAESILAAQMPDDEKEKHCEYILENNSNLNILNLSIYNLIQELQKKFSQQ